MFEELCATVGTNLPRRDEDRLFEIANQFGIRHFNPDQNTGYDQEIWLDWIFRAFLNSIHLSTPLLTRNEECEVTRCPACHQGTLAGDSRDEVDEDGVVTGGNYTLCTNCTWTSG